MKKIYSVILFGMLYACSIFHKTPLQQIRFTDTIENEAYTFIYQDMENSPELNSLKSLYNLDSVAMLGNTENEQALHLLNWTHTRWKHNGSNKPSKSTTLTILKEAETGMKFRCVEYGIVLKSVLACNGFKARTLGLKTIDVETKPSGAGHVLTEAWSAQHEKWFLLDAQFNLIPTLENKPLNAVEFQNAIIQKQHFKLIDLNGEVSAKRRKKYLNFISEYLYYFDFKFDQREVVYDSLFKVNDKTVLMLVPDGAKKPTKFQLKFDLNYVTYTNSLADFYRKP
tara:strand:- start:12135 stop:12983 length:849 start_codon:yes stop_codon:yes gene_type:complete